jgi:hypothetical protein
MNRRIATPLKLSGPLICALLLYGGGVANSRCASATGIGCIYVADGSPVENEVGKPDCQEYGTGCYGCVSHQSGAGARYVVCSMLPDGSNPICANSSALPGAGWPGTAWDWLPSNGGGGGGGGGDPCTVGPSMGCPAQCASCSHRAY